MPNYTGFGKVKKLLKNASKFYADYHLEVVRWLKELHRLAYSLKADLARGVDCKDIANMKRQATAELALSQQTLTEPSETPAEQSRHHPSIPLASSVDSSMVTEEVVAVAEVEREGLELEGEEREAASEVAIRGVGVGIEVQKLCTLV
ncbi:hypothetical protein CRG98_007122 [Punica granatum]|uniref:Uncharacterized protein n=1 Tax=Punica granatum TaxID=22663 RepID=A0A2I0KVM1_PUNGR|nr:hypothetical protein CRG98_007122 [Punica granatum]